MCSHSWKRIGDTWVCMNCGLTRLNNGRIYFDRKITNITQKKRKDKKHGVYLKRRIFCSAKFLLLFPAAVWKGGQDHGIPPEFSG